MDGKLPRILYHYCSTDTFFNIVKNKSIWLCDISKSNDSQELNWIYGQFKHYIGTAWDQYANRLEDESDKKFFHNVSAGSDVFFSNEPFRCFAFCLSGAADNLGQWRGYANDGKGVSLGFRPSFFETLTKASLKVGFMQFDKVQYGDAAAKKLFIDKCGLSYFSPETSKEDVGKAMISAVSNTLKNAPFYKNKAFREEKEYRLAVCVATPILQDGRLNRELPITLLPEYVMSYDYNIQHEEPVSHFEVKNDSIANYVAEICLGPKCKWSVEETILFLVAKGWLKDAKDKSILVKKSGASYR